jgi:hypothetical protein
MMETTQRMFVGRRPTRGQTTPMRVEITILARLKIAAAFAGISVMEYSCRVLSEAAERDIEAAIQQGRNGSGPLGEDLKVKPKKSS